MYGDKKYFGQKGKISCMSYQMSPKLQSDHKGSSRDHKGKIGAIKMEFGEVPKIKLKIELSWRFGYGRAVRGSVWA